MTTRMTRAAAAAAAAQVDLDAATNMALPSSPATMTGLEDVTNTYLSSPLTTQRSTSGSKLATVQIAEDVEATNMTAPRPGSPAACAVLKPSGKAKQLVNRERSGMRMSSNKENMKPQGVSVGAAETGNVVASGRIGEPAIADATEPILAAAIEPEISHDQGNQISDTKAPLLEQLAPREVTESKDATLTKPAPKADRRASRAPTQRPSTAAGKHTGPDRRGSVVIPHSKPRPMSMSFPTPPPPPKSSKSPTRPTFALPGEAVAAKLKAAKEARLARAAATPATVAEPEKRPAFKARPAPRMVPDATKVRTTAASRAREDLMFPGRRATIADPRRASSVMDRRAPTPAIARQSLVPSAVERRAPTPAQGRRSVVSSSMSAGRPSMGGPTRTDKGREVYGRAAAGLLEAKKAQKDKEEAAKKARAEAAERGRLASKEWAEKQQRKLLAAKKAKEAETNGGGAVLV